MPYEVKRDVGGAKGNNHVVFIGADGNVYGSYAMGQGETDQAAIQRVGQQRQSTGQVDPAQIPMGGTSQNGQIFGPDGQPASPMVGPEGGVRYPTPGTGPTGIANDLSAMRSGDDTRGFARSGPSIGTAASDYGAYGMGNGQLPTPQNAASDYGAYGMGNGQLPTPQNAAPIAPNQSGMSPGFGNSPNNGFQSYGNDVRINSGPTPYDGVPQPAQPEGDVPRALAQPEYGGPMPTLGNAANLFSAYPASGIGPVQNGAWQPGSTMPTSGTGVIESRSDTGQWRYPSDAPYTGSTHGPTPMDATPPQYRDNPAGGPMPSLGNAANPTIAYPGSGVGSVQNGGGTTGGGYAGDSHQDGGYAGGGYAGKPSDASGGLTFTKAEFDQLTPQQRTALQSAPQGFTVTHPDGTAQHQISQQGATNYPGSQTSQSTGAPPPPQTDPFATFNAANPNQPFTGPLPEGDSRIDPSTQRTNTMLQVRLPDGNIGNYDLTSTAAMEDALRAGGTPLDPITGQPLQWTELPDGGILFDVGEFGMLPMNTLLGEDLIPGQAERLAQYYGDLTAPGAGKAPGAPLGFGSLSEPYNVPFTGQSTFESKPFEEKFNYSYDDFFESPAYLHRLDQGQKAIDRASQAGGRFNSPRRAQELTRFAEGEASQEFGNQYSRALGEFGIREGAHRNAEAGRASDYERGTREYERNYNIWSGDRSDIFNRNQALSGGGQVAGNQLATSGSNAASQYGVTSLNSAANINDLLTSSAASRAAGVVGSAAAGAGGVTSLAQSATDIALLRSFGML
jgi:hypothetical protein